MRNLLNPRWIILFNTLPVLLLAALCYAEFRVIYTLLPPESLQLWQQFGSIICLLTLFSLGYSLWTQQRKQTLGLGYGLGTALAYSAFMLGCLLHADNFVPLAVPSWMVPTSPVLYVITFLMLTIAHAMYVLVAWATPEDRLPSAAANFGVACLIPLLWFLLLQFPSWFWRYPEYRFLDVVFAGAYMLGVLVFLFFVARGTYILSLRRASVWGEFSLVWKALVALIFPLLGLLVNQGLFLGKGWNQATGIFGNFSSPWFFVLAVLNGTLLCWPDSTHPRWRLGQYLGRSALFGYTCYFFLVFLPFLPLSVLAVLLIGVGFLMLTPLLLMLLHLRALTDDYDDLRQWYSRRRLVLGFLVSWSLLPLCITGEYLYRRSTLHAALDYVYNPNYAKAYDLDAAALGATLNVVKQHKERNNAFVFSHMPYLSTYFNWLVLDNLTLSDSKIATLEKIFLGQTQPNEHRFPAWVASPPSTAVVLRRLHSNSTFDARQQMWVSWLNLEVVNTDTTQRGAEYVTTLQLPAGCWVGDYYLDIGRRREHGILAEQKAAAWVFAQIVNENTYRDPGLLSYVGPDRVQLKVYPVTGRQVRRTGLQLLHREPFVLTVDGQSIALGDPARTPPTAALAVPGQGVAYVSGAAKQHLPLVHRQPYYHFLIDVSSGQRTHKKEFARRIQGLLAPNANFGPARFTLVNAYATPVRTGTDWFQALTKAENTGGFYLDRAIRQALARTWQQPAATYPVLVVVTDSLKQAILPTDFASMSPAYPEADAFYVLTADGSLRAHSLRTSSLQELPDLPRPDFTRAVRAWPGVAHPQAYLPNNSLADVVLTHPQASSPTANIAGSRWLAGLLLQGQQQWQVLHPEATDAGRAPFIQASFRTGIMTAQTSYLALENDAQKAALRRKQQEVLSAKAALDAGEQTTDAPIDEGVLLLLLAGVALGLGVLHKAR